ncbi:Nucleoporin nup82 [Neurospora sp. IMI 360204]|nr:Nucleoporin nup82 [Neurospora sp. IMI 360204]
MPKIQSFSAPWLQEPNPGHKLFEQSEENSRLPASIAFSRNASQGPKRTIAQRGNEVFVARGREIRWGDIAYLKDAWEAHQSRTGPASHLNGDSSDSSFEVYDEETSRLPQGPGYRIIKTPVASEIRQLVISPNKDQLAVLTSHTVHVCMLPDTSHLTSGETAPFKPKFWTLGPTTHVTSKSAVVSALWHPLGVNGSCLVTVTEDAVVREWELSTIDRWSFDTPTLEVDLKRLADGTSVDQDFSASTSTNKAFSPDDFDMKVASASFASRNSNGWAPMTLWVAMAEGDVYALCPLLPRRWSPPPTLIPSLSVSVAQKIETLEADPEATREEKLLAKQQLEWMADLDNQEPKLLDGPYGEVTEVYSRPSRPGSIPRLQGPFELAVAPEDEQDDEVELKDIFVIGAKRNTADLMMGEDFELYADDDDKDSLSMSVICLLSTSGQVKICLDIDGVEAQWLPPRNASTRGFPDHEIPSLLVFHTFDTLKPAEITSDSWPVFSEDVTTRYAFYVTHAAGITYVSLAPWISLLESELQSDSEAGVDFRFDLMVKGQRAEVDRIYTPQHAQNALAAATAFKSSDLSHFVLSATHNDPVIIFFDTPESELMSDRQETPVPTEHGDTPEPLTVWEPRPLFHPSEVLSRPSTLPSWVDALRTSRKRPLMQQEVRLSVATLEIFTEGHRLVSSEVFELNNAVAELFRKCEALTFELKEQINKVYEVNQRIETISGEGESRSTKEQNISEEMLVRNRIDVMKVRQENLARRVDNLRKRLGQVSTRELSDKEKAWAEEVRTLASSILGDEEEEEDTTTASISTAGQSLKRFEEVQTLRDALFEQAQQLQSTDSVDGTSSPMPVMKIPSEIRKQKAVQVMSLLDRETALVEAVKSRLEKLSID